MINPLHYDHGAYIAAAYGLFALATLYFALGAAARLKIAESRIRAVDRPYRTSAL